MEPTAEDAFVWMGGSYSPPTIAHIEMAALVGSKVASTSGLRTHVFFVPVNDYYKKKSVSCVTVANRIHMLKLACEELNGRGLHNVFFHVSIYEVTAAEEAGPWQGKEIKTYESIKQFVKEYGANKDNIYISQGQDNIEGIVAGKWAFSRDLIFNCKLVCIPRVDPIIKDIVRLTRDGVKGLRDKINVSKLNEPGLSEAGDVGSATEESVLERITILDVVPRLVSSTDLRKIIRGWYAIEEGGDFEKWVSESGAVDSERTSTLRPILDYIVSQHLYLDASTCETGAAGGGRKTRRKRRLNYRFSLSYK
jgi:nicotinic acid mononucleotide adenylyltransferase